MEPPPSRSSRPVTRPARYLVSNDVGFLTAGMVRERYGVSDMWLHRKMKAGLFPKPVRLANGRLRHWRLADLIAWEATQG